MSQVMLSKEAELDLLEIWLFIAEGSPVNADFPILRSAICRV